MTALVEAAAGVILLAGAGFILVAAIGVVRFGDVFMRMHAATKAGTVGVGLTAIAAALVAGGAGAVAKALLVVVFILATAPISAHLIGRAAYGAMSAKEREACRFDAGAGAEPGD